jgi:hypothetical protein
MTRNNDIFGASTWYVVSYLPSNAEVYDVTFEFKERREKGIIKEYRSRAFYPMGCDFRLVH